jgi:hypothetical protein
MNNEFRKIVRQVLKESYWTDRDWNDYFSTQSNTHSVDDNDELYKELEMFLRNKESFAEFDVLSIMDIAKKVMPEVNEYDLIDLIKSSLSQIEEKNDEMDGIIRGRAKRAYKMVDNFYEKVNEVVSAVSTSPNDNQMADPGVSAVSTSSNDNQMASQNENSEMQEESKEKNKKKKKKPKDMGNPYTISLPSGSFFTF